MNRRDLLKTVCAAGASVLVGEDLNAQEVFGSRLLVPCSPDVLTALELHVSLEPVEPCVHALAG